MNNLRFREKEKRFYKKISVRKLKELILNLPLPKICCCPTKSSNVLGRILSANGFLSSCKFVNKSSNFQRSPINGVTPFVFYILTNFLHFAKNCLTVCVNNSPDAYQ